MLFSLRFDGFIRWRRRSLRLLEIWILIFPLPADSASLLSLTARSPSFLFNPFSCSTEESDPRLVAGAVGLRWLVRCSPLFSSRRRLPLSLAEGRDVAIVGEFVTIRRRNNTLQEAPRERSVVGEIERSGRTLGGESHCTRCVLPDTRAGGHPRTGAGRHFWGCGEGGGGGMGGEETASVSRLAWVDGVGSGVGFIEPNVPLVGRECLKLMSEWVVCASSPGRQAQFVWRRLNAGRRSVDVPEVRDRPPTDNGNPTSVVTPDPANNVLNAPHDGVRLGFEIRLKVKGLLKDSQNHGHCSCTAPLIRSSLPLVFPGSPDHRSPSRSPDDRKLVGSRTKQGW